MCRRSNTALCVIDTDLSTLGIQSQHHNPQIMDIQDIIDDEIAATYTTDKAGTEMQFSSGYDKLIWEGLRCLSQLEKQSGTRADIFTRKDG